MALTDGLDQRQSQSDAAVAFTGAGQAVKRLKNPLALRFRHAGSAVMHFDHRQLLRTSADLCQFQADVASAVAPGVFQQVANQPAQQTRRALQSQAVAV